MKRFRELSGDEMKEIVDLKSEGGLDIFIRDCWVPVTPSNIIDIGSCYRVKPKLDEFDWSLLPPEYKFIRRDKDGRAFAFQNKPFGDNGCWWECKDEKGVIQIEKLICYKNNGMPWDEMILDRPEGE